jgi:hypothetical protein
MTIEEDREWEREKRDDLVRSHDRIRKMGGRLNETIDEKIDRAIENLEDILIYLRELKDDI